MTYNIREGAVIEIALRNGTNVIGTFAEITPDNRIKLDYAFRIQLAPMPTEEGLSFAPQLLPVLTVGNKLEIEIPFDEVLGYADVVGRELQQYENIRNNFIKARSGIEITNKMPDNKTVQFPN